MVGDGLRDSGLELSSVDDVGKRLITRWHKEFSLALMMEASELMDWSAWKHWSTQLGNKNHDVVPFTKTHVREIKMEIVDCLHFLVNLSLLYGISSDDLYLAFVEKNSINHKRQDSGSY